MAARLKARYKKVAFWVAFITKTNHTKSPNVYFIRKVEQGSCWRLCKHSTIGFTDNRCRFCLEIDDFGWHSAPKYAQNGVFLGSSHVRQIQVLRLEIDVYCEGNNWNNICYVSYQFTGMIFRLGSHSYEFYVRFFVITPPTWSKIMWFVGSSLLKSHHKCHFDKNLIVKTH